MKRLNHLVVLSVLATLILALVAFGSAGAEKPVIERFKFDVDDYFWDCGFPIPTNFDVEFQTMLYFDKDGMVRGGANLPAGGSKFTMRYNENTLVWHNVEASHWDVVGDGNYIVDFTGLVWGISVPGYGRAVATSGRDLIGCHTENEEVICDELISSAGLRVENLEVVCNYMLNGK